MITHSCEQLSEEWFAARLGKVTASCFGQAMAGGAGKTRKTYMIKLVAERLTGEAAEGYMNAAMQRGIEVEPEARAYYEAITEGKVEQVGFVELDENIGCSPDGLVGEEGMLEIKCPNASTHIETILANRSPAVYNPQIQGQLWVTGRTWCDFVSFDPRVKARPFWFIRVYRDEQYIAKMEIKITAFVIEFLEMIEKIRNPF